MTSTNDSRYPRRLPPALMDRRSLLRGVFFAGGVAAIAPGLAACGGDDDDPGAGTSPDENGGSGPVAGGELIVGKGDEIADFDPFNHASSSFPMMNTLYSYLITYDDSYEPHPDLAEEWTIADDGASAEITLREAVFHDGSPVTSQDIITGIERAQNPDIGLNQIASSSFIATATEVDERTVRLEFKAPTTESRVLDFMHWFPVIQGTMNDPEKLATQPAGSGPFVLENYAPGNNLVMAKNPDYYDADLPYLDKIEVRFFADKDSLVAGLEAGSVDVALGLDGRHYDRLKDNFTIVTGAPGALIVNFYMNTQIAPFDNKQVRQAVARAIDRERMIEQVQFGVGQPVYANFPPNSPSFDQALYEEYGFDLEAAETLLQESGVEDLSATCIVNEVAQYNVRNLEIMQEDLASIGFDLKIEPRDGPTAGELFNSGEAPAYIGAAANPFRSPVAVTFGGAFATVNNPMLGEEVPPEYTAAIEAAETAVTPEDEAASAAELNQVFVDQAWAIGVYTLEQPTAMDPKVMEYARTASDHPVFTEIYIEE